MNKVPPRFLAERIGLFVAVACAVVYLVLKQFSILNNLDAEIGMLLFMVFVLVGDAILARGNPKRWASFFGRAMC